MRGLLLVALAAAVAAGLAGAGRLTTSATAAATASAPSPITFKTGPNAGAPLDIAKAYLAAHAGDLRGSNVDVAHLRVTDQYADADTSTTYIYFQQTASGVPINRALINVGIAKNGAVITVGDRSINQPAPAPVAPTTSQSEAAAAAIADAGGGSAVGKPELTWVQTPDGLKLAWIVQVMTNDGGYEAHVDAHSADVLATDSLTSDATETSTHDVFPIPFESPLDGGRAKVGSPADPLASPFGWNDTDGVAGPEFTTTRGNNVYAYVDAAAPADVPDPGSSPDGGPSLNFDFPLDLATQQPTEYRPFAVSNLYYMTNIVHDVLAHHGFGEVAGNFQQKNYSGQGLGGDPLNAEAQDLSGLNNANMTTFAEGSSPRMQMYVWRSAVELNVTAPASIAGIYTAGSGGFGPPFGAVGLTGDIALATDASNAAGPATDDACTAITNPAAVAGKIAIVRRGSCEFSTKVENVQLAGAVAAIVQNNNGQPALTLGAGVRAPFVTIPSLGISDADGAKIRGALPATASMRSLFNDRDSDLDNGVISHEYGHGWSNRLTGGPSTVNCLSTTVDPEQMGEGWSDFLALTLTAKAGETATTSRGMGNYVSFLPRGGVGIRPTQYTTDTTVNPSGYGTLASGVNSLALTVPHGVGYVWATMLWEMYWNLVNQYGFDPNIYDSWDKGGNNLALRLVSDGMKLQPCSPGFVDGRNGILLADQNLTGGKNQCLIWKAFAKRGVGLNADQGTTENAPNRIGTNDAVLDQTADTTLPTECVTPDIDVAPGSLSATQLRGKQTPLAVTVKNTALLGSVDANWTVSEAASDCASPSNVPWLTESPASGSTAPQKSGGFTATLDSTGLAVGTHTARLCVTSNDADEATVSIPVTLNVQYAFTQQSRPGGESAGRTIPIRFSLDGNEGLAVFAGGYPQVQPCGGGASAPADSAGSSTLAYDASTNTYQWNWKTDRAWAGSCRALVLKLIDGTTHTVQVNFN
jgi:hypothetical protein